jgi:hypothetical protein
MVTLASFVVFVVNPVSLVLLAVLLFPFTPLFVLEKLSQFIWKMNLKVNGKEVKVIHFMLVLSLLLFIFKFYSYLSSENPHGKARNEFTLEDSMKHNRAGRDFYISLSCFGIWVYIWRVIPLIGKLVS